MDICGKDENGKYVSDECIKSIQHRKTKKIIKKGDHHKKYHQGDAAKAGYQKVSTFIYAKTSSLIACDDEKYRQFICLVGEELVSQAKTIKNTNKSIFSFFGAKRKRDDSNDNDNNDNPKKKRKVMKAASNPSSSVLCIDSSNNIENISDDGTVDEEEKNLSDLDLECSDITETATASSPTPTATNNITSDNVSIAELMKEIQSQRQEMEQNANDIKGLQQKVKDLSAEIDANDNQFQFESINHLKNKEQKKKEKITE